MIILYFLNLLVIINAILIAKSVYSKHRVSDKVLISFVIYLAQIIFFILLLGIPGLLTLPNLAVLTLFSFLIAIFIFRHEKTHPFFPYPNFIREALIWISRHRLLTVSISLLLGFSLVKIFHNLINPPFWWGSLIYHYTFPVGWLKSGNLVNLPIAFGCSAFSYIAMNGEFFFFWFMVPLKNFFIADVISYPFYIVGAIACFGIMRKLAISKEIALMGGVLFSLTPQYFKHLLFNGNDIIVVSLFLIALNFVLLLKKDLSFKNIVIAAISLGLLLGTKSTAMIWVPLLMPLVLYFMIKRYKNIGFSGLVLLGATFVMLVLIFGGFTYIRNFVETGNPFYPVNYELFGLKLSGAIDFFDLRDNINLLNNNLEEMLFHQSFGLHFIALAFPAFFLSLPIALIKSKFRLSFDTMYLLALPLLMIIGFYAKCPHHTPRLLYPLIGLGTIIGIYTLNNFRLSTKVIRMIIFALIIAAVAELTGHMTLLWSLVISGLIFATLAVVKNTNIWRFYRFSGILFSFIFLIGLIPLENYYEETKYKNYAKTFHWERDLIEAWNWIYGQTLHNPKNIAYAGSSPILPLYGRKMRNNVHYASVNDKEPYLTNFSKYFHLQEDFQEWLRLMRQDGCIREKANFSSWLKNLRRKDTDYLFIMCTDDFKVFPLEDKWAKGHPRTFRLVLANKRVRIYEVLKESF